MNKKKNRLGLILRPGFRRRGRRRAEGEREQRNGEREETGNEKDKDKEEKKVGPT